MPTQPIARSESRRKVVRWTIGLLAILLGFLATHYLGDVLRKHYNIPEPGRYRGRVGGTFAAYSDHHFFMRFHADTSARWHWTRPTNFAYSLVKLKWSEGSVEWDASVSLVDFTYTARATVPYAAYAHRYPDRAGVFTRDTLRLWLAEMDEPGRSHRSTIGAAEVNTIFTWFEDAARGTLPPPRHHTYRTQEPVVIAMQHWDLGFRCDGIALAGVTAWVGAFVIRGTSRLGRKARADV